MNFLCSTGNRLARQEQIDMPTTANGNLSADYWAERLVQVRADLGAVTAGQHPHPYRHQWVVALQKYADNLLTRWAKAGGRAKQTA